MCCWLYIEKSCSPVRSGAAQLHSIQTEVSKEYSVGKEGVMASSPMDSSPRGWMLQLLILWRPSIGFCLGVSLRGQQPVEKIHVSNRKACRAPCGDVLKLAASNGVADGAHRHHPSSSSKTMCEVSILLITYCCIRNYPQMSKHILSHMFL